MPLLNDVLLVISTLLFVYGQESLTYATFIIILSRLVNGEQSFWFDISERHQCVVEQINIIVMIYRQVRLDTPRSWLNRHITVVFPKCTFRRQRDIIIVKRFLVNSEYTRRRDSRRSRDVMSHGSIVTIFWKKRKRDVIFVTVFFFIHLLNDVFGYNIRHYFFHGRGALRI